MKQDHEKKRGVDERNIIEAFIPYYQTETRTPLEIVKHNSNHDKPDFICKNDIGVEITEWMIENKVEISKEKYRLEDAIRKAIRNSDLYDILKHKGIFISLKRFPKGKHQEFVSISIECLKTHTDQIRTQTGPNIS